MNMLTRYLLHSMLFYPMFLVDQNCRERDRPVTSDKEDSYVILDAKIGDELIMQCRYCNEKDNSEPRIWHKTDRLESNESREVRLGMENEPALNRVRVNEERSLIINNFSGSDVGLYTCLPFGQRNKDEKFNYLVDLVRDDNFTDIESGEVSSWSRYHSEFLSPINNLLRESEGSEFVHMRDRLKVGPEAITQWGPWSGCKACGRPPGEGRRRRRGRCRLKLTPNSGGDTDVVLGRPEEVYFLWANAISCRSIRLAELFPGIANLTRVVPDFVLEERCGGTCNPDQDRETSGWKSGKTTGFKYRKTIVLAEGSHLTLVCPESSVENTVTWRKRGKVLRPGDASDPHLMVGIFSTLYLAEVTASEAGNYTCQVDDIRMQQVIVFVASRSRLLTQELTRHMAYLAFVLSLTASCYCAGLTIACHRRRNFKSYEELIGERPADIE